MESRSTVYNKITTSEKLARINSENTTLLNDFIEYMKSVDRAEKTIKNYTNDIKIFFVWNLDNNNNKFFVDIKKRELVKFQNYAIEVWGWSPNRVRRVKSVLSSLSKYIEDILDDEYEDFRSIVKKIESPARVAVRDKTVLPVEAVELLLDTLVKNKDYEKACAAAIFAYSGMRKSELVQMKVEYFNDDNIIFNALYETNKIRSKGRGKQGKMIHKYVMLKAKCYIDLWKRKREELGIDNEWLFVTKRNNQWVQRKTIDYWMNEFSTILELDVYPHSFRHFTCTYLMSDYNLPVEVVKDFFSWESVDMIQIYNDKKMVDDFGKYFSPDGVIKQEQISLSDLK